MPEKRSQRKEDSVDWDGSGIDESSIDASDNRGTFNSHDAGVSERGNNKRENVQTGKQSSREQPHRGKDGNKSHQNHRASLGPWRQAVAKTAQDMGAAQKAIESLQGILKSHLEDLDTMEKNKTSLRLLEEQCLEMKGELQEKETTIRTLSGMNEKAAVTNDEKAAQLEKEKRELVKDKEKQKQRIAVATEEQKHKLTQEFEERRKNHDKTHEKRMKELERSFDNKSREVSQRETALKSETEQLSAMVEQQEKKIKTQADELKKMKEDYDLLGRAKDSFKNDLAAREKELQMLNKEFALDSKPVDYFKKKFEEIYSEIEKISEEYFHDIQDKDLDEAQKKLSAADSRFDAFIFSDTDDSHDLRTAHAQHIISKAICTDIWKPFQSEFTMPNPEFSKFLCKISDELEKSSGGGRTAKVWAALTMQALQSLQTNAMASPDPKSKQDLGPAGPKIIDSVISKVFVLSPLINSSQTELLREDLLKLVRSSVDLWNNAYAGGLKITVNTVLNCANREEWRAHQFDPELPLPNSGGTDFESISKTRPRVLTLFPRVTAQAAIDTVKKKNLPPGSWPRDSDLECIHPGSGLPEWSPLVVRGRKAQDEKREAVAIAIENAKKNFSAADIKRGSMHGRRASKGSLISVSTSPSEKWRMEGVMKSTE